MKAWLVQLKQSTWSDSLAEEMSASCASCSAFAAYCCCRVLIKSLRSPRFLLRSVCQTECFYKRRLYSFCVDTLLSSAQCIRKCCILTLAYSLVFRVTRLVCLVEVMPHPHISLIGTPRFCVFFTYSGSTFLGIPERVCLQLVGLSVLFCWACLCPNTSS